MRTLFLAILLACAALTGCRKPRVVISPPPPATSNTLVEGTVIKSAGVWNHEGKICHNLSVFRHSAQRMNWRFYSAGPGGGPKGNATGTLDTASPTDPWFIYVESPDRLWFFDGAKNLSCGIWSAGGSDSGTFGVILHGALQEDSEPVPAEVIQLLPAELQKLFSTAASKPRPSI